MNLIIINLFLINTLIYLIIQNIFYDSFYKKLMEIISIAYQKKLITSQELNELLDKLIKINNTKTISFIPFFWFYSYIKLLNFALDIIEKYPKLESLIIDYDYICEGGK